MIKKEYYNNGKLKFEYEIKNEKKMVFIGSIMKMAN